MFLMAACTTPQAGPQDHFTIKGTIVDADMNGKDVYLVRMEPELTIMDSTKVENNSFTFTGDASDPYPAYITVFAELGRLPLFLENYSYEAVTSSNLSEGTVTGGETQQLVCDIEKMGEDLRAEYRIDSLRKVLISDYKEMTDAELEANIATNKAFEAEYKARYEEAVTARGLTYYTLINEVLPLFGVASTDSINKVIEPYRTDPKFAGKSYFNFIEARLAKLEAVNTGKVIPDMKAGNLLRQDVSLSETYAANNLTLVQFWASWNNASHSENAALLNVYNKYHSRGFEIYGVAFEKDFSEWNDAITADRARWIQVSDLEYWDSELKDQYQLQYVPFNFLVNREGVIIARNVKGEDLEKVVSENL